MYDLIIVGAGPAGIFTALELLRKSSSPHKILLVEKGKPVEKRHCPKDKTGVCVNCKPTCAITTGFSGAGAFSDGKLSLSYQVGGELPELIGEDFAQELINYTDKIYLEFGADPHVEGIYEGSEIKEPSLGELKPADKWILSKVNTLAKDVTENMDKYEMGIAVQKVYDFIWDEFCDWYIEMVKPRLYATDDADSQNAALWTLKTVLIDALKLLHPYMPFITEEIFCTLQSEEESIMISSWPVYQQERHFEKEEQEIEILKEAVRGVRNVRTSMNVPPSRKAHVYVVSDQKELQNTFEEGKLFFASLASASDVTCQADKTGIAEDAVSVVIPNATLYIPFAELVDLAKEIERLEKEEKRLEGELSRVNGMLHNERFMSKAPESKIAEERGKLEKYTQMMEQVKERLGQLRK